MYSQVHNYWDIDTILIFLALYTTTMDLKWHKMCFNCRLSALIWGYLHPNQVNGVGITTVSIYASHLFKGPKVMGQLAAQLFHGQVCVIPSLSHLQGADKRSRFISSVLFSFGICCCQLSIWDPKSCHYQWSKPSLGWKIKTNPIREIAKTLDVAKSTFWNIL